MAGVFVRFSRFLIGLLPPLAAIALPQLAAATTSDSSYSSPDLHASTGPPWNPAAPVPTARPWETTLRLPGRIASLPLVAVGNLAERSLIHLEQTHALDNALVRSKRLRELGIGVLPASLGDHTGVGGEVIWAPFRLDRRLLVEANATTHQYTRERVSAFIGPWGVVYTLEWRPRELYFGPGLTAPLSGESSYGERSQSAKLLFAWGWQSFDSVKVQLSEPLMFHDRVRVRGPMHRTWVSAWAGPRERSVTRGREPGISSFEIAHPVEAAGSLYRGVEHFSYGAGLSHDARWGRPHWSGGWRASVEAERFDKSIRALALNDAHSGARSFTRLIYHAETGASFGRDPHTLRLALTAVDQKLDVAGGTFLLGDLQSLGGSAGLAGFEYGRFRDFDLLLAKLSYIFPLVKNLEFDLHTESGGVYPGLMEARIATFKRSFGAALRFRTEAAMFGAVGCDWSSERTRLWLSLGGIE
jgi:hypothetical protein